MVILRLWVRLSHAHFNLCARAQACLQVGDYSAPVDELAVPNRSQSSLKWAGLRTGRPLEVCVTGDESRDGIVLSWSAPKVVVSLGSGWFTSVLLASCRVGSCLHTGLSTDISVFVAKGDGFWISVTLGVFLRRRLFSLVSFPWGWQLHMFVLSTAWRPWLPAIFPFLILLAES